MGQQITRRSLVVILLLSISTWMGTTDAADKNQEINAEKLIGVWKVAKDDGKEIKEAEQISIEFTKGGAMKIFGNEVASYKLEGDKLILTPAAQGGKAEPRTVVIKTIAPEHLVLFDEKQMKELELKKGGEKAAPIDKK